MDTGEKIQIKSKSKLLPNLKEYGYDEYGRTILIDTNSNQIKPAIKWQEEVDDTYNNLYIINILDAEKYIRMLKKLEDDGVFNFRNKKFAKFVE